LALVTAKINYNSVYAIKKTDAGWLAGAAEVGDFPGQSRE
jgi:hypothetical protein